MSEDRFVVVAGTAYGGKQAWAIWYRPDGETTYTTLICRVYDPDWAAQIVELLNISGELG